MPRKATLTNGDDTLRVSLETIDVDRARELLELNDRNRNLSAGRSTALADCLSDGDWILNGETIVFDTDGALVDGQHRLDAVVRSGVPIVTLVVHGVAPVEAQDTTDQGTKRTLAQQLQITGERNTHILAAALNVVYQITAYGRIKSGHHYPTVQMGRRVLEERPAIRDSLVIGNRLRSCELRYKPGVATALHYLFTLVDDGLSDLFWESLRTGEDLESGTPIFTLRKQLIRDASMTVGKRRMGMTMLTALTVKAWNLWVSGESCSLLKYLPTEDFPDYRNAGTVAGQDPEEEAA